MTDNDYSDERKKPYRQNVGIALFNADGDVLLCQRPSRRKDPEPYQWQMPQGGIDDGENIINAALRELHEETNIAPNKVKLLKQASKPYKYTFPPHILKRNQGNPFQGQEQHWVALRFLGENSDIDLRRCPDPSFISWRWEEFDHVPALVVPFKRDVYKAVLEEFQDIAIARA